jgi:uncharacterized protein YecT (DUF1311 family)
MIELIMASLITMQDAEIPQLRGPVRPMVECSEHMNSDRALRNCLDDLLDNAEDQLGDAIGAARQEAREIDLDMPGIANAVQHLEAAHSAWNTYRDAECRRRATLLMIGDNGEAVALDCRISVTRARTTELREQ